MSQPTNPYIDQAQKELWDFGFRVGMASRVLRESPLEARQGNQAALRWLESQQHDEVA
jgi:UTP:GlnB (protein PII) uridylyltransferase